MVLGHADSGQKSPPTREERGKRGGVANGERPPDAKFANGYILFDGKVAVKARQQESGE